MGNAVMSGAAWLLLVVVGGLFAGMAVTGLIWLMGDDDAEYGRDN